MPGNAKGTGRELVPYGEAQRLQRELVRRRASAEIPDLLWLLEHPPTITWGSAGGLENVRLSRPELEKRRIDLCPSERGGNVTYHGPGQLVGYPIVDLSGLGRDLHRFLRLLERALIDLLAELGIAAASLPGRTGVWVPGPPRKIAAIGIRASRWISSHGFALNVDATLDGFALIVPCGIRDAGVTSLTAELGARALPAWDDLCDRVHRSLERALERPLLLVQGPAAAALAGSGPPDGYGQLSGGASQPSPGSVASVGAPQAGKGGTGGGPERNRKRKV